MQDIDSILDNIKGALSNIKVPDKKAPIELTQIVEGNKKVYNELFEDEIRSMLKDLLKPYLQSWIKNNIDNVVKEAVIEEYKNSLRR